MFFFRALNMLYVTLFISLLSFSTVKHFLSCVTLCIELLARVRLLRKSRASKLRMTAMATISIVGNYLQANLIARRLARIERIV